MSTKKFHTLKDVSSGDALTSGLMATGFYFLDQDGKWYRGRGTLSYGLNVDVKKCVTLTMVGNTTATDAYANPTNAVPSFSFLAGWNGATWDRIKTAPLPADIGILQRSNHFIQNYSLLISAARTTSSQTAALTGFGSFRTALIQLAVTAQSGATPTLDVYIDSTIDNTNWLNIAHFTQLAATTGRRILQLSEHTASGVSDIDPTTDLPAGTVRQGPWGSSLRVRWVIGGATPSFTFSVAAMFKA